MTSHASPSSLTQTLGRAICVLKWIAFTLLSAGTLSAWCTEQTCPVTPNPSITNISPTEAAIGEQITINGTNFGENINQTTVKIGGRLADKKSISSTGIVVIVPNVPSGGQAVTVEIGQPARVSNSVNLTVTTAAPNSDLSKPVISISSPKEGEKISLPFTALGTASHESGLVKLEYAIDGGVRTPISLQSAALFGIDLKTLFVNGPHELTVFAKGASGTEAQFKRSFVLADPFTVDKTAPMISTITPSGTAVNKTTAKISVTFNEAMNTSFTAGIISFTLPVSGAPTISNPTWSADSRTLSVTIGALTASTAYKFKVANTAKDISGNALVNSSEYGFTTAEDPILTTNLMPSSNGSVIKDFDGYPTATPPLPGPNYQFYSQLSDPSSTIISLRVGNGDTDFIGRGLLRFMLPSNVLASKIIRAELILTQYKLEGTGAWSRGLYVEGADFDADVAGSSGGGSSDAGVDFESAPLSTVSAGTTDPGLDGKVTIDVTAQVKSNAAVFKPADFRLRMGGEATLIPSVNSGVRFYGTRASDSNAHPVLRLTFSP
jgi:hypothetical protein